MNGRLGDQQNQKRGKELKCGAQKIKIWKGPRRQRAFPKDVLCQRVQRARGWGCSMPGSCLERPGSAGQASAISKPLRDAEVVDEDKARIHY